MECKNCGERIHVKYCSYCGQEPVGERLTVKETIKKFIEALTHAETSVFSLAKNLIYKPGEVSREYIQGKRKKYYSPMKYLVLVVTLSALITLHYHKYSVPFEPHFHSESELDDYVENDYFNHNYYKYLIFFSIPLAALVTMFVFRNSGLNYSENLVFNMYIISQVILLHTVIISPLVIFSSSYDDWIILTYMILAVIYMVWSYTAFFEGKKIVTFFKAIAALIIFTFLYNVISHYLYSYFAGK